MVKSQKKSEKKSEFKPKVEISLERTNVNFKVMQNAMDSFMRAINLKYINYRELRFDGQKYIAENLLKKIDDIPSKFKTDIIKYTIEICNFIYPPVPMDKFVRNSDIKLDKRWDFIEKNGYVYDLLPEVIVEPNYPKHYEFFLPFVLRHCDPNNVTGILFYHKDAYYENHPKLFYYQLNRIIKSKPADFWIHENTVFEIEEWLKQNITIKTKARISKGYQLKNKHNNEMQDTGTQDKISLVFDELQENDFIDKKNRLSHFRRIFRDIDDIKSQFVKVNWIKSEASLHCFINELINQSKVIKPYGKWVKCSELFNLNGNSVNKDNISKNTHVSEKDKNNLERIVGLLY